MKNTVYGVMIAFLLIGLAVSICGCEVQQLTSVLDVFTDGISEAEYDDLPIWEKLLYTENDNGRYVKHDLVEDLEEAL